MFIRVWACEASKLCLRMYWYLMSWIKRKPSAGRAGNIHPIAGEPQVDMEMLTE